MTTIVKIFPKVCSCGNELGSRQYAFERAVQVRLGTPTTSDLGRIPRIQADVAFDFGWTRMCCRNAVFNCATYFIRDSNRGSFVDEVGITAGIDNYDIRKAIVRDGPPVMFKISPPGFPPLPGMETVTSPRRAPIFPKPVPRSIALLSKDQVLLGIPNTLESKSPQVQSSSEPREKASVFLPFPANSVIVSRREPKALPGKSISSHGKTATQIPTSQVLPLPT